jgi:hypothetical protein
MRCIHTYGAVSLKYYSCNSATLPGARPVGYTYIVLLQIVCTATKKGSQMAAPCANSQVAHFILPYDQRLMNIPLPERSNNHGAVPGIYNNSFILFTPFYFLICLQC